LGRRRTIPRTNSPMQVRPSPKSRPTPYLSADLFIHVYVQRTNMPQKAHAFVNTRKRKRKHAASDKHAEPTTNKRNETRGRWQAVEENSRLPTESMPGRLSSRPAWPATRLHTRTLPQGRRLGWVAPGMLGVRRHRTGLGSGDKSKKECRPRIFSRDGLRPHETRPPKGDVGECTGQQFVRDSSDGGK
jgi:hypothetical protein